MKHNGLISMRLTFFFIVVLLTFSLIHAQETPTLPDLTGFTVPDAAAELHRVGLQLGEQQVIEWDESQPINTIVAQSPAGGSTIIPGMSVSITVMRPFTVRLVYDDNDFTLINQSRETINPASIIFRGENTSFSARRWERVTELRPGECLQVWSVARTAAKDVEGCDHIEQWLTTNNRAEHFWMSGDFQVIQEGIERAVCVAGSSAVQDCSLYIGDTDTAEYLYFTYDADQFLVMNRSKGRWLPTAGLRFGDGITPDETPLLAPGQCLMFTSEESNAAPLENCVVMVRSTVSDIFWDADFQIRIGAGRERCPASLPGERMICVVPR